MSIPDEVMWDYFMMLTDYQLDEIQKMKTNIENGSINPFNINKILGELIVSDLDNADLAKEAARSFENITINKDIGDSIPNYELLDVGPVHLPKLFTELNIT